MRLCHLTRWRRGGDAITGVADRYGGPGIGHNGGSGRAAVVNSYHVKGIGRTPLVSALTDDAHASGGAYLEECVREVIFSELAGAEFPGGTVPVLAVIDTGLVQVWKLESGAYPERRCLLVRPAFLRPAHFERARAYISDDPADGYADAQRVEHAFRVAIERWGQNALSTIYEHLWLTWAEQLAYAFIHRLPHGGDSTSNIALNGRLLDFGGMTAVPSLARISLTWGAATTGDELLTLMQALTSHAKLLGRYVDASLASKEAIDHMASVVVQRYRHILFRELLRLIGWSATQAEQALRLDPSLPALLNRALTHYRREHFTIFDGTPVPRIAWDIDRFWSEHAPAQWKSLCDELVHRFQRLEIGGHYGSSLCRERSRLRSASRPMLYRERIKQNLYDILERQLKGDLLNQESLDRLVADIVCRNRRDGKIEPSDALPVGFARNAVAGYALFRRIDTGALFAIAEWKAESNESSHATEKSREIFTLDEDGIVFADASAPDFLGVVCCDLVTNLK